MNFVSVYDFGKTTGPLRAGVSAVILSVIAIAILKPDFAFYSKNSLKTKPFGVSPEETLLPVWLFISLIGYLIYAIYTFSGMFL